MSVYQVARHPAARPAQISYTGNPPQDTVEALHRERTSDS